MRELETGGEVPIHVSFRCRGAEAVTVGSVITLVAPDVDIATTRRLWVHEVRDTFTNGGYWSDIVAHAASGHLTAEADPSFAPSEPVSTTTRHIGVATIPWYRDPSPYGATAVLVFHPGGAYRAVRVRGRFHGANSSRSGSPPETMSMVEVWQDGVFVADAPMPVAPEYYSSQRDYTDDLYWRNFDVIMAADIANAPAELRFTSGEFVDGSRDDYEIKETTVVMYAEPNERSPIPASGADWHAYQNRNIWRWVPS